VAVLSFAELVPEVRVDRRAPIRLGRAPAIPLAQPQID
jgi:hypothetical protein